jgi:hypothetical protein
MTKRQKELFEAVGDANLEEVRRLLATGIDPNVKGRRKSLFSLRTLMEGAVEIRAKTFEAMRNTLSSEANTLPRFQSRAETELEIIKELIRAGAQLNPRTTMGSPLYVAAAAGDLELVILLLDAGAGPNTSPGATLSNYDEMPLHAAACGGYAEIVEALLKAGADRTMENWRGKTPLEALRERNKSTAIETWERVSNPTDEMKALIQAKYEAWTSQRAKIEHLLEAA